MSVIPKCTSWWGHKFEARYSLSASTMIEFEVGKATAKALGEIIDRYRDRTYEGEVCVRCGYQVPPLKTVAT